MTEEDRTALAGEYVLGTLQLTEHAAFAARIAADRETALAVRAWERLLAPLASGIPEEVPPPALWPAILARLGTTEPLPANDNRLRRWRAIAATMAGVAAALIVVQFAQPPRTRVVTRTVAAAVPAAEKWLAALNPKGSETAVVLTLDATTGQVEAHSIKLTAPAARNLELWWIANGAPPKAVGLLDPARAFTARLQQPGQLQGGLFAVSVEPVGGSTTGAPTGPVVYTGQLLPPTRG